jgi:hypothetical protein
MVADMRVSEAPMPPTAPGSTEQPFQDEPTGPGAAVSVDEHGSDAPIETLAWAVTLADRREVA